MNKKSLLCQYANYKKVVQEKSAAISQNVRLDGLFQNLKKRFSWDSSYILEVLQAHCAYTSIENLYDLSNSKIC